jgi:hypothetical protein
MVLKCALCLFGHETDHPEAITVINGIAVCYDHMGIVATGQQFHAWIEAANK